MVLEDVLGKSVNKEAIVIDTRFNGGGNLDEALTVFLSGEVFMRAVPRGQEVGGGQWSKCGRVKCEIAAQRETHLVWGKITARPELFGKRIQWPDVIQNWFSIQFGSNRDILL